MQLYLQIQQISADIRDYLQIWQLSAQCMCIPPCHTVASNYWSKQIYLQIWLLSADKVPICRYPSYLQIYRYGENLADIYLQIYRQVYRQIISADWTIGRTLLCDSQCTQNSPNVSIPKPAPNGKDSNSWNHFWERCHLLFFKEDKFGVVWALGGSKSNSED